MSFHPHTISSMLMPTALLAHLLADYAEILGKKPATKNSAYKHDKWLRWLLADSDHLFAVHLIFPRHFLILPYLG